MDMDRFDRPAPKMAKSELTLLLDELRELKRVAEMGQADFDGLGYDKPEGITGTVTEFIRRKTEIWRRTWLIDPIDSLIERYESALKKQHGAEA